MPLAVTVRSRTRVGVVLGTLLFAALVMPSVVHAAPAGAIDARPCIAFDDHGYRYIAFARAGVTEAGIYLATNRSGTWRLSPHPVTAGDRCAAITVDPAGRVHLLITRPIPDNVDGNYNAYYATNKSGAWRASKVHFGEVGVASLAVDRTGRANIAITDEDGVLVFRRAASGGWITPYTAVGWASHLRVDSAGTLWLAVADAHRRRIMRLSNRSGTWTASPTSVPYTNATDLDLTIDGSDRRSIVVYDGSSGFASIYRDASGSWPRVDRTQAHPGRRLEEATSEPSGAIHLMLVYGRNPGLGFVDQNRHGDRWHTQLIGYVSSSRADIDIDARGRVAAVFERDGVVWSYWNKWTGTPHRFRISDL